MKQLNFYFFSKESKVNYTKFATGLVHRASEFSSDMTLINETSSRPFEVDLKSILGVMSLYNGIGQQFLITIEGKDEEEAYMSLKAYTDSCLSY